ncbi:MAG: MauE/DoxX family redox-associated membrane protein [Actinomycetaceae bacterium]
MVDHALHAATMLLTVVLLVAGIRKLARPPSPAQLAALGLPRALRTTSAIRLHAVAEVAAALALVAVPGPWLAVVGGTTALLAAGYLVIVLRAWRSPEPLACHCFGGDDDRPVGRRHLALVVALVAASVAAVVAGLRGWWALADLHPLVLGALGVLTVAGLLLLRPDAGQPHPSPDAPYLRRPIPPGRIVVDGVPRETTDLASRRAQLLLRLPRPGTERERLLADLPGWREQLTRMDVAVTEGGSGAAYRRLGLTAAPSAVVLGTDGLLAAGPVTGDDQVRALVRELASIVPTTS